MWQLLVAAGALWVAGRVVVHLGWWISDKTQLVAAGAGLIAVGAILEYLAVMAILVK